MLPLRGQNRVSAGVSPGCRASHGTSAWHPGRPCGYWPRYGVAAIRLSAPARSLSGQVAVVVAVAHQSRAFREANGSASGPSPSAAASRNEARVLSSTGCQTGMNGISQTARWPLSTGLAGCARVGDTDEVDPEHLPVFQVRGPGDVVVQHPPGASRQPQLRLADHLGCHITGGPAAPRQPRRLASAAACSGLRQQPARAALRVRGHVTGNRGSIAVCAQLN